MDRTQFNNEVLSFDMVDPGLFVRDNDIKLKIELWDNNAWNDDILGEVTVSAVRFLSALEPQEEWLPLVFPGDESSNSKVQVEFRFEEAKVGMAVFTLYEGKNLGTSEMKLGGEMLSPYVSISMGDNYHKRSQTQVNGGQDPYFAEEQVLMWVDEENWTKPATLTTWHEVSRRSERKKNLRGYLLLYIGCLILLYDGIILTHHLIPLSCAPHPIAGRWRPRRRGKARAKFAALYGDRPGRC